MKRRTLPRFHQDRFNHIVERHVAIAKSKPEADSREPGAFFPCAKLECLPHSCSRNMLVSKEYVGYLARQLTKKLIEGEFIETTHVNPTVERVNAALLEEMQLEDRINDEVRMILEAYQEEMRTTGASYQEMFKKVKQQLVQKYKAVL
jgi:hypothetical protein